MQIRPTISGCGMYVPERVLTNRDLEKMVNTSDEWITQRTGIRARRIAAEGETSSSMGLIAARRALESAGLGPEDIDLVIVGTATPDFMFPATACLIQNGLGVKGGAFDVEAGCTSFMYALSIAAACVASGAQQNVLVVGTEVLSRIMDWTDRSTCVLFGDGAGAVVMSGSADGAFDPSFVLGADGSGASALYVPAGGSSQPAADNTVKDGLHFVRMAGPEVFRFATRVVVESTQEIMDRLDLAPDDIDLFIPHQANERIIDSALKRLHFPRERTFVNIEKYGNTSSASIPIALTEAREQGRLFPGATLLLVGFGAGLTWAAGAIQWDLNRVGKYETQREAQPEREPELVG
ncbi:MAG TPA: beta-ketoacyl-ACP synthase III [Chloroflexota bacterium]|jgi:3-oxoacyl-[acyl-carrier-protein] synthase-3|nr:beta-ketoacyl-ACP synthase III [Chloroflexota bacterium]